MTVSKKLYSGTSTAVIATLLLGGSAWYANEKMGNTIDRLVKVTAKKLALAGDINTVISDMVAEERAVLFAGSRHNNTNLNKADEEFKTSSERLAKNLKTFLPLLETVEGRKVIGEIQGAFDEMMANHKSLLSLASGTDSESAVKLFDEKVLPLVSRINSRAESLTVLQTDLMAKMSAEAAASNVANKWMTVILLLFSALSGAVLFYIVRKLSADVSSAVEEISQSAGEVDQASVQIATASQRLAQASCEQAASIEETSASTEEIGSMTRRNSENSKSAAALVDKSVQGFAKSNRLLDEMLSAMEGISESSDKISRIIKVIDEIAFQTNILALNAAVEAARAGEAGMGFAVVADEVRNLAQRCAQAAKDTAALIEDSIAKSRDGKSKVSETAGSIRYVSDQAGEIKTLIDEVTLGSVEQTRGIEQISKALSQMDQATQTSAANAEESASASQELQGQASSLRASIQRVHFMFTGLGEAGTISLAKTHVKGLPENKPAPRKFTQSVSALKTATRSTTARPAPATVAAMSPSRDEFPLEESFTEF